MAKRPRYSRWRRLPGLYRLGEDKGPDPNLEPQRLTLYLPGTILDGAEAQAKKAGIETIQEYCTDLLRCVIEAERVREQVAEVVLRHSSQAGDDPPGVPPQPPAWRVGPAGRDRRAGPRLAVARSRIPRSGDDPPAGRLRPAPTRARGAGAPHRRLAGGAFDAWTVDTIRAVQEAVDRVLSGEDIRYYPTDFRPEDPL